MAGHLLDPFHAEARDVADAVVGRDAAERPVIAAGDEAARARVRGQRQRGAVVHRHLAPGLAIGEVDQAQRAVAQREGRGAPGPIEARGDDEGAEFARDAAMVDQEGGR